MILKLFVCTINLQNPRSQFKICDEMISLKKTTGSVKSDVFAIKLFESLMCEIKIKNMYYVAEDKIQLHISEIEDQKIEWKKKKIRKFTSDGNHPTCISLNAIYTYVHSYISDRTDH